MDNRSQYKPFSLKLATVTLQHKASPDGLYIQDIFATFGNRSQAFLVLFFTLPFVQPLPLFGLSTLIGIILMTLGVLIMLNRPPWLPQKILRKHLPEKLILSCCRILIKILNKTEKLIKPRMAGWTTHRGTQILNGFLIILFAFLLSLPLPIPFSNSLPAFFLVANALGELEEDGVLMWISYVIGGFVIFFFVGLGIGIREFIEMMLAKF